METTPTGLTTNASHAIAWAVMFSGISLSSSERAVVEKTAMRKNGRMTAANNFLLKPAIITSLTFTYRGDS
jgi:hypothetical protein